MRAGNRRSRKTGLDSSRQSFFQSINCSPMVKGKTPIQNSCLTSPILVQLKESYNKNYPNDKITHTDPKQIWTSLKSKLSTCSKEDCWLDIIDDKNMRKKLDKYLFAPDHPDEWNSKPNAWLSNFDINDVLRQYELTYKNFATVDPSPMDFDDKPSSKNGKCVSEELCKFQLAEYLKKGKTKIGLVFNLDKHTEGGSHWVALYIDLDDNFLFFMDSTGEEMTPEIDTLVKRIVKQGLKLSTPKQIHIHQNCPTEHQMGTTECGMYSLYFIVTMLTGKVNGKPLGDFSEKIKFFKDQRIPDKHVSKFRKIYFNSK
jgi:hypothetical protein